MLELLLFFGAVLGWAGWQWWDWQRWRKQQTLERRAAAGRTDNPGADRPG